MGRLSATGCRGADDQGLPLICGRGALPLRWTADSSTSPRRNRFFGHVTSLPRRPAVDAPCPGNARGFHVRKGQIRVFKPRGLAGALLPLPDHDVASVRIGLAAQRGGAAPAATDRPPLKRPGLAAACSPEFVLGCGIRPAFFSAASSSMRSISPSENPVNSMSSNSSSSSPCSSLASNSRSQPANSANRLSVMT